jgi:hypothetical protein
MSKESVFWVVADTSPNNAGYRVRTVPLAAALEEFSIVPRILPAGDFIASVKSIADEAALVILAKPSDTVMFLCMKYLASRGVRVIADIFDNYFSWSAAIYQRGLQWQWLRAVDPDVCSGVITSTPYLAGALRGIGVSNVCLVSDLAPDGPLQHCGGLELNGKWRKPERLEILWFGISGNPYFTAGLEDLMSWTRVIDRMRARLSGHKQLRLTICTNDVPAVGAALKCFASQGIDARFVAWTQEGCEELLQASHVVLLPSNLSGFSLSKTHNRCSEALWRHCLVLASPGGPYRDLGGAVYRDVNKLCDDLLALDESRINANIQAAAAEISRSNSKAEHARRLAQFITSTKTRLQPGRVSQRPRSPQVLVLGSVLIPNSVDLARQLGFVTASFERPHRGEEVDLVFGSGMSADGKITIRMSDAGKAAVLEAISSSGKRPQAVGIAFEQAGPAVFASVALPALKPLYEAAELVEGVAHMHIDLRERMHDIHTEIIIKALGALGFTSFDLCTEAAGGWESYARLAAPGLQRASVDLRRSWHQQHGNATQPRFARRRLWSNAG